MCECRQIQVVREIYIQGVRRRKKARERGKGEKEKGTGSKKKTRARAHTHTHTQTEKERERSEDLGLDLCFHLYCPLACGPAGTAMGEQKVSLRQDD